MPFSTTNNTNRKQDMNEKDKAFASLMNSVNKRNATPLQEEHTVTSSNKRCLKDKKENDRPDKKQKILPVPVTPAAPSAPVVRASTPIGSHGLGEALDLSDFSPIMVNPRVSPNYSSPPSSPPSSPRASLLRYKNLKHSNKDMTTAKNLYQRLLANDYEPLKLPCYSEKDEEYDL
ncbi:hypothetical protein BDB01DRAFT_886314 [Pilobolus umbonatus]|nr:hypothetical protein BDB01DRAFT_886314 [Pilobolus umbonatus]